MTINKRLWLRLATKCLFRHNNEWKSKDFYAMYEYCIKKSEQSKY